MLTTREPSKGPVVVLVINPETAQPNDEFAESYEPRQTVRLSVCCMFTRESVEFQVTYIEAAIADITYMTTFTELIGEFKPSA